MTGKRQVPVGMEPVGRDAPARRVERSARPEVVAEPVSVDAETAAALLGVSRDQVRQMAYRGALPCLHIGDRHLFRVASLATYVAEREEAERQERIERGLNAALQWQRLQATATQIKVPHSFCGTRHLPSRVAWRGGHGRGGDPQTQNRRTLPRPAVHQSRQRLLSPPQVWGTRLFYSRMLPLSTLSATVDTRLSTGRPSGMRGARWTIRACSTP